MRVMGSYLRLGVSLGNATAPKAFIECVRNAGPEGVVHTELDMPTRLGNGEARNQRKQSLHDLPALFHATK